MRRGLLFTQSYYASLRSTLPYTYIDLIKGNIPSTEAPDYLRAVGRIAGQLHNAGIIHRDFSRGNLLLGRDAEGHIQVELVDLNRLRFHTISPDEGLKISSVFLPPHKCVAAWQRVMPTSATSTSTIVSPIGPTPKKWIVLRRKDVCDRENKSLQIIRPIPHIKYAQKIFSALCALPHTLRRTPHPKLIMTLLVKTRNNS